MNSNKFLYSFLPALPDPVPVPGRWTIPLNLTDEEEEEEEEKDKKDKKKKGRPSLLYLCTHVNVADRREKYQQITATGKSARC